MSDIPKAASKIDPLAEFHRLKEETAVINAKMRASAPLLNSSVSSSDALLGIILKELKAMRVEVKEVKEKQEEIAGNQEKLQENVAEIKENLKLIKEDIRKMKEEQNKLHEELREVKEAQKQSESRITENLKLKQESQDEKLGKIQEDLDKKHESLHKRLSENESAEKQFKLEVTENLKTMMLKMDKIQEDVTSNEKNLKAIDSKTDEIVKKNAVSEEPIKMDIKKKICGKWRDIDGDYYSYKIKGNKFFERCRNNSVKEYTLGVKHSNGYTATVEIDKIIQKSINANGEEDDRFEYCLEDGKLVGKYFSKGEFQSKDVFERVGDPEIY